MDYLLSKNSYSCDDFCGVSTTTDEFPDVHENKVNLTGKPIYYISDLHVEYKNKKGFKDCTYKQYIDHVVRKMNGGTPLGDDPLLIVGDISVSSSQVEYFFSQLRMRRDGLIIFVLGNHEIWDYDEKSNRNLLYIIEKYKKICTKHDIILLHNELAFFYDERTGNGELLPYFKRKIISTNELLSLESNTLQEYSRQAKLIVYGGIGFSGVCKDMDKKGRIYNAEYGLYKDIVSTLKADIEESIKCEKGYLKVLEALNDAQVIISTHTPFNHWSTFDYNPNFIYVYGHTHFHCFENTKERTIFADNQVGYSSDCYGLNYFYIDGTYDTFKYYKDGIHKITYNQYIDFNIGKNIKLKKKDDGKQIYLLKKSGYYMFVYYNACNRLLLLNGGSSKYLTHDINYYYNNLATYGQYLNIAMDQYTSAIYSVSCNVKRLGGKGNIHGCIVDIDYYNHIYLNPFDGSVVPYYAIDMEQKCVYKDLETLLKEKCPLLLPNYQKWKAKEADSFMMISSSSEIADGATLVHDKSIYKVSGAIKTIQYILFQNVVRDWNDRIIQKYKKHSEDVLEETNKININDNFLTLPRR